MLDRPSCSLALGQGRSAWIQTTGVYEDAPTSAGSQRCLRSCMRAVVRPCCRTSCCTDLTLTRQADSIRLLPATLALLGPSAFAGVHRCWRRLLEPPDSSADFQTERWQAGRMGALFVLAGILVGLAVYRSGEARARWQSLRAARTTARNQRNTAWRHTGSAVLYVAGAILLLFIVLKLFK